MKKFTILLSLFMIMSLLLAACSGSTTDPTSTPPLKPIEVPTQEPDPTATAVPEPTAEPQPSVETVAIDDIMNINWQWVEFQDTAGINDLTVPNPENYTITFLADGTAAIKADCNSVSATYRNSTSALSIRLGASTMAFCGEESLDTVYLVRLSAVASFVMSDGNLVLNLVADGGNLVFANGGVAEQPQTAELTGTVTYLQRIALPDDAILHVQLQDISQMDTAAQVIGEQRYATDGAQVPLPFTITYNPADIQDDRTYGLSVRISDSTGRLLFVSDTAVPIITNGVISSANEVIAVAVGSDTSEKPASPLPPEIVDIIWQWDSFSDPASGEINIEDPASYQIQFTDSGTFLFVADCNSGSGTYTADQSGISLTIGPITRAFCGEDSLDTQYLQYLEAAAIYFMQDSTLHFDLIYDSGTMHFTEATEVNIEETAVDESDGTISEDGLELQVSGVAESYEWSVQEGQSASPGPGGVPFPPHILLTFDGQSADDALANNGPRLYIFPVATYTAVAGDIATDEFARLQTLITVGDSDLKSPMPLLPTANTLAERWTQFSPLNFVNGQGVRYVADSPDRLAIGVWSNASTAYYYQGLTNDGRFYVSLIWPISTDSLPNSDDDASAEIKAQAEGSAASFETYVQTTREMLDGLSVNAWSPTLTALDEMVASLNVQN